MRRQRGFSSIHRAERLESRRVLAGELSFAETAWRDTWGEADRVNVVADFDGDGTQDFMLGNSPSGHGGDNGWFRLDHSSGRLIFVDAMVSRALDHNFAPIGAADIDRDGDIDLFAIKTHIVSAGDRFTTLGWLPNTDGRGTFEGQPTIVVQGASIFDVAFHDLDADGDIDISYLDRVDHGDIQNGWAENIGGQFIDHRLVYRHDEHHLYDVDNDGLRRVVPRVPLVAGRYTVDLDGDGDLDLVDSRAQVDFASQTLTWSENISPSTQFQTRSFEHRFATNARLQPDDIDRDGDIDIWIQSGSQIDWLRNDGRGRFTKEPFSYRLTDALNDWTVGEIVVADVDGDGHNELVAPNPVTREFMWYDNDTDTLHATNAPGYEIAQAMADLNGDGKLDLVGLVGWYEQTERPESPAFHRFPPELQRAIELAADSEITTEDVDHDGDSDLLVYVAYKGLSSPPRASGLYWWENADGHAMEWVSRGVRMDWPKFASLHNRADLDGDGDLDTITITQEKRRDTSRGTLATWEQSANGQLRQRTVIAERITAAALGDVDGDGDCDIIAGQDQAILWFENIDGHGQFAAFGRTITDAKSASYLRVGDLNGDGDLDLVVGIDMFVPLSSPSVRPDPRVELSFFDNFDGQGQFHMLSHSLTDRGALRLVGDFDGDRYADLFESPQAIAGIIWQRNVTRGHLLLGDINHDDRVSLADIDLLRAAIQRHETDPQLDLNRDGQVDLKDHRFLFQNILGLSRGDANGDGVFALDDLARAVALGGYGDERREATWEGGDWNGDGHFTTSDLVMAFQESIYRETIAAALPRGVVPAEHAFELAPGAARSRELDKSAHATPCADVSVDAFGEPSSLTVDQRPHATVSPLSSQPSAATLHRFSSLTNVRLRPRRPRFRA